MNNKKIGLKIRSIRASKNLSQANVAEDLGMTSGAYAKIERGETDANVSRLLQIAQILDVSIHDFFEEHAVGKFLETKPPYGFASKEEVESLHKQMQMLLKEFEKIKSALLQKKSAKKK